MEMCEISRREQSKNKKKTPTVRRGEVYWASIKDNGGSVQNGRRLVLIVQNNIGNFYSPSTIVIPFTSRLSKKMLPTHLFFKDELPRPSILLCEQIITMDVSEIFGGSPVAKLDPEAMKRVDQAVMVSLGITV